LKVSVIEQLAVNLIKRMCEEINDKLISYLPLFRIKKEKNKNSGTIWEKRAVVYLSV